MDRTLHIALLLLSILHCLTSAASYSPPVLPSAACSDELVRFSSCLPFVAVFPHNLTDFPPPQCCDDVSAAFGNGSAVCLCYFVFHWKIVEFPINSTKLLSLASLCPLEDQNSKAKISLETLCSGAERPPLPAATMMMGTAKFSSATEGDTNDAPPMQQSPSSDYPPVSDEMNSATSPPDDLSTLPEARRRPRPSKSPKPPNPPPTQPKPPSEPIPDPKIPIQPNSPDQAQGPSSSESTYLILSPSFLTGFAKWAYMSLLFYIEFHNRWR